MNKKMTYQYQDDLLLYDILDRNYFQYFQKNSEIKKFFNITFFYDNNYTNTRIIPQYKNFEELNNEKNILQNWEKFLKWYNVNNFYTEIHIHDDKLFNNYHFLEKILNLLIQNHIHYQNIIFNINFEKQNDILQLFNIINNYKDKLSIKCDCNILINNIDKINKLIFNKINILIPPGLTGQKLIEYQSYIFNSGLNINKYIEIDSDLWDEKNIKEYLIYINFLLTNNSKMESFFNTNLPIGIIDQHIIDNSNCKKDCDFQNSLNILISNLSINLCHKFQYDDQIIGFLIEDESKGLKPKAEILPLIMFNTHLKRSSTPHCENCAYVNVCKGFCYACSYEKSLNPIIPIRESCNLKKVKYTYIFNYLSKNKNLINFNNNSEIFNIYLFNILNNLKLKENSYD